MPVPATAHGGVSLADPFCYSPLSRRHKNVLGKKCFKTPMVTFTHNTNGPSIGRSFQGSLRAVGGISSKGTPISLNPAPPSDFLSGDRGGLLGLTPTPPGEQRTLTRTRARTGRTSGLSYPAQAEKPVEWWWRSLAAAPYLIACQFSDAGYYVQPLLEHHETLEDLIFYIPGGAKRWFVWLPMVYCFAAYSGVVKNKKWPHFLRYHLIMAMLLETALQVVWVASNWMPLIHFNGAFGMYYWAAVGFFYIGVLLYGVRCALGGKYNKIPFVGEAALIHTNYSVGGFHRPF